MKKKKYERFLFLFLQQYTQSEKKRITPMKTVERETNVIRKCILLRPQASILSMFSTVNDNNNIAAMIFILMCIFNVDDSFGCISIDPRGLHRPSSYLIMCMCAVTVNHGKSFIGIGK